MSRLDPSYFWFFSEGELVGMLPVHVDDAWGGGTDEFVSFFKEVLEKETELGKCVIGQREADFVGMHLEETEDGLYMDQDLYIDLKVHEVELCPRLKTMRRSSPLGRVLWGASISPWAVSGGEPWMRSSATPTTACTRRSASCTSRARATAATQATTAI